MKVFDDDHPELIEGERTRIKRRISRTRFVTIVTREHRHRPPVCCGQLFVRPMTESESEDYHRGDPKRSRDDGTRD